LLGVGGGGREINPRAGMGADGVEPAPALGSAKIKGEGYEL